MSAQIIIELNGLRFFGEHGMYEEERRVGNEFECDISIIYKSPKEVIRDLNQTISYAEVYRIASEVLSERKELLETCAMEIAQKVKLNFPQIKEISISIKKLNAPITSFIGKVGITFKKRYKNSE
ncbi:MAG TPA: dihydroneopterin aldolase [Flavisolibacter sp.]|nr:dihydroneopterin aldolase [Flavisolibacter sp.]